MTSGARHSSDDVREVLRPALHSEAAIEHGDERHLWRRGEPVHDTAAFSIVVGSDKATRVLEASGPVLQGNLQAHER